MILQVFLIISSSVCIVSRQMNHKTRDYLVRKMKLVIILLIMIDLVVVEGKAAVFVKYSTCPVKCPCCIEGLGIHAVPGLIGFFESAEYNGLDQGF